MNFFPAHADMFGWLGLVQILCMQSQLVYVCNSPVLSDKYCVIQMFTIPLSYILPALFSMMILEPWWGCYIDVLFRPRYSLNIN